MREIKFRAWDGKHFWLFGLTTGSLGNKSYRWPQDGDPVRVNPDTPMQQYTGLKDKNGTEIYEGDIVEAFGKGVVEWFDNLNWDSGGSLHSGFYCKEWFEYQDDGCMSYHYGFDDCEVIGNIYENPELLP